jgi:hypothetical protein
VYLSAPQLTLRRCELGGLSNASRAGTAITAMHRSRCVAGTAAAVQIWCNLAANHV